MKNLTPHQKQRIWKGGIEPLRTIFLLGIDNQKNPCLVILYGRHKIQMVLQNHYYHHECILEPSVRYTHYAVFHGINGHLPSVIKTYYHEDLEEKNLLLHHRGYKTMQFTWERIPEQLHRWQRVDIIDPKYIIPSFYPFEQNVVFNYYQENRYEDYVALLKHHNITFHGCQLIENPSTLFGFSPESPYYENIFHMFLQQRLYVRKKHLNQFIKKNPSVEDYKKILSIASVELACGIFQELSVQKNPILLETAQQILHSNELWAKEAYHNGLRRCIHQYINLFDEALVQEQKNSIYERLPEMDFHIKRLNWYNTILEGEALQQHLNQPFAYDELRHSYPPVFGRQVLYERNTYTDGKDFYNIPFKDTIQRARAYDMADALGKIAYYLDAPRTSTYLKAIGKGGAYRYYVRYIRRVLDEYKSTDESKFMAAVKEMLTSYTDNDNVLYQTALFGNYFFNYYFRIKTDNGFSYSYNDNDPIWHKHIEDMVYIAKNAQALPVHEFCYAILKTHSFDDYPIQELIVLAQIPHEETAKFFEVALFTKLETLQEFDAKLMIALMESKSANIQYAASQYFVRTNGKFTPENIAALFSPATADTWYDVIQSNINAFTTEEYIAFIKIMTGKNDFFLKSEKEAAFSDDIKELLQYTTNKLEAASIEEQQQLLQYFIALLSKNTKWADIIGQMAENILFFMPYPTLKDSLEQISLEHDALSEKNYHAMVLLKAIKTDAFPKDSYLLSILDTASARLVKTLTEVIYAQKEALSQKNATLLLLLECNVYSLNKIAQTVFEAMEIEKREKMHMLLLDSPVQKVYQYGLEKLDSWYEGKIPKAFIVRMLEHPCLSVQSYVCEKMEYALSHLEQSQPDIYVYYAKTLLYLPNKASKSKEYVYSTLIPFLQHYPEKRNEIEAILLDIGSTNTKFQAEKALVAFAQIQKEVCHLCK